MSEHHEGRGLGHVQSVKTLAIILVALLGLTWLTYETGSANLQGWDLAVAMIIATIKASRVALFFMHLKWERGWKYVLLAPTTILAIGLPIALMPDIGWSYYHRVPTETMIEAGHHGESDGAPDHGN